VTTQIRSHLTDEPGVRFGIANGLLVAALLVAASARLDDTETEYVAVLAAGFVSVGLSVALTAWIGVIAWALFTGFVENGYGQLTFQGADLRRLVVFAAATLVLAAFTRGANHLARENAHE
jgi:hypothetical protein